MDKIYIVEYYDNENGGDGYSGNLGNYFQTSEEAKKYLNDYFWDEIFRGNYVSYYDEYLSEDEISVIELIEELGFVDIDFDNIVLTKKQKEELAKTFILESIDNNQIEHVSMRYYISVLEPGF